MKIGLWSDCHNFPSLPLMKLSAYHKQRGDEVDFANHLEHYDVVYASKVFSFTHDIEDFGIINADEIKLVLNGPLSPMIVKPVKGDCFISIVVPMRLAEVSE